MVKFDKPNEKKELGRLKKREANEAKKQKIALEREEKLSREWEIGAKDNRKQDEAERIKLEKQTRKNKIKALVEAEEAELSRLKPSSKKTKESKISFSNQNVKITLENDDDLKKDSEKVLESDSETIKTDSSMSKAKSKIEKHPEKRMKAAYTIFEEKELPKLREENPSLKMSQLRQMLSKLWKKSLENPINNPHLHYNASRFEEDNFKQKNLEALERLQL